VFDELNRVNLGLPGRVVFLARADVEAPIAAAGRITKLSKHDSWWQVDHVSPRISLGGLFSAVRV
jgi:hypothetical protein